MPISWLEMGKKFGLEVGNWVAPPPPMFDKSFNLNLILRHFIIIQLTEPFDGRKLPFQFVHIMYNTAVNLVEIEGIVRLNSPQLELYHNII